METLCCAQSHSGNLCDTVGAQNVPALYCSFGPIFSVDWRGGICWTGNHISSLTICPGLCPGEVTSALPRSIEPTREAAIISYKPALDWHRVWHHGLLPMVGEILRTHWIATTRLNLGSPQSKRCCLATACLIGCLGFRLKATSTLQNPHQRRTQVSQRKGAQS